MCKGCDCGNPQVLGILTNFKAKSLGKKKRIFIRKRLLTKVFGEPLREKRNR